MKTTAFVIASTFSWVCSVAQAQESHCTPEEQPVFSCSVGRKTVSLCASKNFSPTAGYLQYRFGRKGAVELMYPESPAHPRQHFVLGNLMYSGGGGDYLKFASGKFQYVVYSAIGRGWEKQGVAVLAGDKLVSSLVCRGPALEQDGWKAVYEAGLPQDPGEFEIP